MSPAHEVCHLLMKMSALVSVLVQACGPTPIILYVVEYMKKTNELNECQFISRAMLLIFGESTTVYLSIHLFKVVENKLC